MKSIKFKELGKKISSLEDIYKNFQEGVDYTVSFDKKGKQIYNIHSKRLADYVFGEFREGLISDAFLGTEISNNNSFEQSLSKIKLASSGRTNHRLENTPNSLRIREIEEGESSSLASQSRERSFQSLQEELSYLRSLPDERGYLRPRIQELERQIADRRQSVVFTQHHQILPKKY